MQKLLVFVNSVIAVFTICSYISGFVNPEIAGIFSLFGLIYPYLLFLNVFFILFWLIVKWKKSFISVITLLIGWGHLISFFGLDIKDPVQITSNDLTIGSFNNNVSYYVRQNDTTEVKKRTAILKNTFLNNDTDIFCMQEFSYYSAGMAKKLLPDYHHVTMEKNTVGIISKYPIIASGEIPFNRKVQSCLWADINYRGKTIRVYSVHMFSNRLTNKTEEIIEERDFTNDEASEDITYIF